MTASFDGPDAKFWWATEHFNLFKGELGPLIDPNLYEITHEFHRERREQIWKLNSIPPVIPHGISLRMGDILYNLRCSLDYVIWQLILLNGGTPTERNEFPIFNCPAKYESGKHRRLKGVHESVIKEIDSMQPYVRPNRPLWALRVLSNTDKHRHAYLTVACVLRATFVKPAGIDAEATVHTGPVQFGTELCTFLSDEVDVKFIPTFDIAFRQTDPTLVGASVINTLSQIHSRVYEILQQLSPSFRQNIQ